MRPSVLALILCLASAAGSPVRAALQDALLAHQALAPIAQSCVVRIEFGPGGPAPIFAAAFAIEDVLWLYAPEFGTFALGPVTRGWPDPALRSTHLRLLNAEVATLRISANPVPPAHRLEQHPLVNACVISSLGALTRTLTHEADLNAAGLILMSYDNNAPTLDRMNINHCLLAYRIRGQWRCIDPNQPNQSFLLEHLAVNSRLDPALTALALKQHYPLKGVYYLAFSPTTLARLTASLQWKAAAPANRADPAADR